MRNQFLIISPIHFYIKEKHEFLQLKLTCNIFFVTLKSTITSRNDTKINLPIQTSENLHWRYQLVICMKNINQFCTKDLNIITSSDMFKQFTVYKFSIFYKHANFNNQPYYYIITFTEYTKTFLFGMKGK